MFPLCDRLFFRAAELVFLEYLFIDKPLFPGPKRARARSVTTQTKI